MFNRPPSPGLCNAPTSHIPHISFFNGSEQTHIPSIDDDSVKFGRSVYHIQIAFVRTMSVEFINSTTEATGRALSPRSSWRLVMCRSTHPWCKENNIGVRTLKLKIFVVAESVQSD